MSKKFITNYTTGGFQIIASSQEEANKIYDEAMSVTKGRWQRSVAAGQAAWSGADLGGKAKNYRARYMDSRASMLSRIADKGLHVAKTYGVRGATYIVLASMDLDEYDFNMVCGSQLSREEQGLLRPWNRAHCQYCRNMYSIRDVFTEKAHDRTISCLKLTYSNLPGVGYRMAHELLSQFGRRAWEVLNLRPSMMERHVAADLHPGLSEWESKRERKDSWCARINVDLSPAIKAIIEENRISMSVANLDPVFYLGLCQAYLIGGKNNAIGYVSIANSSMEAAIGLVNISPAVAGYLNDGKVPPARVILERHVGKARLSVLPADAGIPVNKLWDRTVIDLSSALKYDYPAREKSDLTLLGLAQQSLEKHVADLGGAVTVRPGQFIAVPVL